MFENFRAVLLTGGKKREKNRTLIKLIDQSLHTENLKVYMYTTGMRCWDFIRAEGGKIEFEN